VPVLCVCVCVCVCVKVKVKARKQRRGIPVERKKKNERNWLCFRIGWIKKVGGEARTAPHLNTHTHTPYHTPQLETDIIFARGMHRTHNIFRIKTAPTHQQQHPSSEYHLSLLDRSCHSLALLEDDCPKNARRHAVATHLFQKSILIIRLTLLKVFWNK